MVTPEGSKTKLEKGLDHDWAASAGKKAELIRKNAALVNLDASRLVRGFVLLTITADDQNIFRWIDAIPFSTDRGRQAAQVLDIRLNWEIAVPELPENIRKSLSEARDQIKDLDLGKQIEFTKAFSIWEENRKLIEKETDSSEELTADVGYYILS